VDQATEAEVRNHAYNIIRTVEKDPQKTCKYDAEMVSELLRGKKKY